MKGKITPKGVQFIKDNAGDGHSLLKAEGVPFADLGYSKEEARKLVREYKSDTRDPKSIIFGPDGMVIKKLMGVYTLTLWKSLAARLQVDASAANMMFGRGSQARLLCRAILDKLEGSEKHEPTTT